jgi:hypothetical protein
MPAISISIHLPQFTLIYKLSLISGMLSNSFYLDLLQLGGRSSENIYYIVFKDKNGKVIEKKAGRQYIDDMCQTVLRQKRQ